ncbi:hypothetical protein AB0942_09510 [Streptomyces nodosus]|uniref:hypothetical protein n=1 Tax=Streptomyces nodosus TaxID=40318 RepID=UPI00345683FF
MTTDHADPREADGNTDAPAPPDRVGQLADQLSRSYDLLALTELATDDPGRAQEHWDAAHELRGWLRRLPKQEEKAAFQRGWDRAMVRSGRRIADLEAVIASWQSGEDLPVPSSEWHLARQDPRYGLVRREILALDTVTVTGEMALPYPLQELLALRLVSALCTAELSPDADDM